MTSLSHYLKYSTPRHRKTGQKGAGTEPHDIVPTEKFCSLIFSCLNPEMGHGKYTPQIFQLLWWHRIPHNIYR